MSSTSSQQAAIPPAPPEPKFRTVASGWHPDQVAAYLHSLRQHISHLEEMLFHGAVQAAESPAGRTLITDMIRLAADEIEGSKQQAADDIAQMRADAEQDLGQRRARALQEAEGIISGAREQAATIISGARNDAKAMTDTASAQATAVSEAAGQRLAQIQATYAETTRRMGEVHRVVGSYLDAEDARGTIEDEVTRVLPAGIPAPPVPGPAVTAIAESIELPAQQSGNGSSGK